MKMNNELDLVVHKTLDVTPEEAYKAWTTPESFGEWFCPKPWVVTEARLDLRPGGEFYTVMQSPEGDKFPMSGCILEFIPNKKLSWTNAVSTDYRPAGNIDLPMTAVLTFEADGNKTKYTAIAQHGDAEVKKKHEAMGFVQGWGICADQLVAHVKKMKS